MDHAQSLKQLIVDYPHEAVALFAASAGGSVDASAAITVIPAQRLSAQFLDLDIPLFVQREEGRREALLFVVEPGRKPAPNAAHRLARCCLELAELLQTDRVIPVVVYLQATGAPSELCLRGDVATHLDFRCLSFSLAAMPAQAHFDSTNLVARLNLPNMAFDATEKLEVYAQAVRGLMQLERDPVRRLRYMDFIDIHGALDENEMQEWPSARTG